MKNLCSIIVLLSAAFGSTVAVQGQETIRPFINLGLSVRPPSSTDLGYVMVGGGSYGNYSVNRFIYGGGLQMLFGSLTNPSSDHTLRFGFDLGWQKLYSSVFDVGDEDGVLIFKDNFTDAESAAQILGLAEYTPSNQRYFLQAGLGLHVVTWSHTRTFAGAYEDDYYAQGNTQTNVGLEAAGGKNVYSSGNVTFPVMVRLDSIFRYGVILTGTVIAGANFTI